MSVTTEHISKQIFTLNEHNDVLFEQLAVELFRYHASKNETYSDFIGHLGIEPDLILNLSGTSPDINRIAFLTVNRI